MFELGKHPVSLEEAEEISVADRGYVIRFISAPGQEFRQARQVGNRVQIGRALFPPEGTIQIGADAAVLDVSGDLADVIHMIDNLLQPQVSRLWGCLPSDPAWDHHPSVEDRSNDSPAGDEARGFGRPRIAGWCGTRARPFQMTGPKPARGN